MPPKVEITDSPGSTVGAYTIATKLGDGELGALLAVRTDGGQGALCMMRQIEAEPEVIKRLALAAESAVGIEHEHLLAIQAVLDGGDKIAIVSEYCEGEALGTLLRAASVRRAHITTSVALRVVLDLLKGLSFAHEQQDALGGSAELRHGGLAPSSIFVGSDGVTRLMDLGASGVAARSEPWTKDGKWIAYASPEAVKLDKELGPEADVFTAGILLWEMLQNKRLFSGLTYTAVSSKVLEQRVGRVDVGRPESAGAVSAALGDVVSRALDRDVRKRFGTAADMAAAIQQCGDRVADSREVAEWVEDLAGRTIAATRASLSQALGRSKSNAPPPVDSIAPLAAAGPRPAPVPRKPPPPAAGPPKPPPKKKPAGPPLADAASATERKGPPRKPAPVRPPEKPKAPARASEQSVSDGDEPADMQDEATVMMPPEEILAAANAAVAEAAAEPKPSPESKQDASDDAESGDGELDEETDDGEWAARARDRARIRAAAKPAGGDAATKDEEPAPAAESEPSAAPAKGPAAKTATKTAAKGAAQDVAAEAKPVPAAPAAATPPTAASAGKTSKAPWIVAAVLAVALGGVVVNSQLGGSGPPAAGSSEATDAAGDTTAAVRTSSPSETAAPDEALSSASAAPPVEPPAGDTAASTAGESTTAAPTAPKATTEPASTTPATTSPPKAPTPPATSPPKPAEPKATATTAPPPPPPPGTAPPKYQPGDL